MRLTRTGAPSAPFTTAQVKAHLRVDGDDEDALIATLIDAAVAHLDGPDGWLGRALEEQVWTLTTDGFPPDAMTLPVGPVVSVDSVAVDGAPFTDFDSDDRCVWPNDAWPDGTGDRGSVEITWTAGTGCPAPISQAMLMLIGHWYADREGVGGIPPGVADIVAPWRRVVL